MGPEARVVKPDLLIANLRKLWKDPQDQLVVAKAIQTLDARYDLRQKMAKESGIGDIIAQMVGRLAKSYPRVSDLRNKKILDIACGSNTSQMPALLRVNTPFGEISLKRHSGRGYTALFEPWFCRILFELEAVPVGIDFGDLEAEVFTHYQVNLGRPGALDFLPDRSFDGIQDSRLFGSPEFTAQFPNRIDRLKVASEILRQEQRLLKADGTVIHSDAIALLKRDGPVSHNTDDP